jgi:hypothetical protein
VRLDFLLEHDLSAMKERITLVFGDFWDWEPLGLIDYMLERGGAGHSIDGFLVSVYIEDAQILSLVVEWIWSILY